VTRLLLLIVLVLAPRLVRAEPGDVLPAPVFDPAACKRKPVRPPPASNPGGVVLLTNYNNFDITGTLVDPAATVRDLLAPTVTRHTSLTEQAREEITASAAAFGYHVVGLGLRETPTGPIAQLHLAPLPMVRRVEVASFKIQLDDEVRRRMRVRVGAYLPWVKGERDCILYDERRRVEEFLHDEGYFDARVAIEEHLDGTAVTLAMRVALGPPYTVALSRIRILDAGALPIPEAAIREQFRPRRRGCLVRQTLCVLGYFVGPAPFTRAQHQEDLQEVIAMFHRTGFPEVRVHSNFDPAISIDRETKTVSFTLDIKPRRRIDAVFEGNFSASEVSLKRQLTFSNAASADYVEATESARAIAAYLQTRGYFDARVTWHHEPFPEAQLDRYVFRIDQGSSREVRSVAFTGNRAFGEDQLNAVIGIHAARLSGTILGSNEYATSAGLAADAQRITGLYRRAGYRNVRVEVAASSDPVGLGSAGMTAALIAAGHGSGLYVRFAIDEGPVTTLSEVHVELGDHGDRIAGEADAALCAEALREISGFYGAPSLAKQVAGDRCVGAAVALPFREDEARAIKDRLRDRLFSRGRARAEIEYEAEELGPASYKATYRLSNTQQLTVGRIVIRGNFRTQAWIIHGELRMRPGAALTSDELAESTRRLRNTALFDSVNIKLPDLDRTTRGAVNAVVEVTERYDYRALFEVEAGGSSYNGTFLKLGPSFKNLLGLGISLDVAGTVGFDAFRYLGTGDLKLRQLSAEATLRFPSWLMRRMWWLLDLQTELTAFHRRQDTPRFGLLRTTGVTLGVSHTWSWPRTPGHPAHALTFGSHYDFRSRERNVDVLRPVGADDDESQVPITTRTGAVGASLEWEQRVDRSGQLSPLSPEAGYRWDIQASYASPVLFGQDTFAKISAGGSHYWPIGDNLVLRGDLRYDHGFPLGGAALLPEVERFFAGGDATVRGYNDDRLATELVQVGVPPLDNISQIRILPAGGNIRTLASVDAQIRIYKLLSTGLFADAGLITNQWSTVTSDDIRPSIGMALLRLVTPFGSFTFERAVPLRPRLGDDPRGRWHISFAARAQF
jgi:outer membrane protein insertion porin family